MCCDIVLNFCYCIVLIVGDCDKLHIQQSLTDIGSVGCVYVNVTGTELYIFFVECENTDNEATEPGSDGTSDLWILTYKTKC
jgi:hypothetical protein